MRSAPSAALPDREPLTMQRNVLVLAPRTMDATRLTDVAACASVHGVNVQYVDAIPASTAHTSAVIMPYDPVVDAAQDLTRRVRAATEQGMDAIVVYDRHPRPWRRLLAPYTYGAHDPAAFALARRLARRTRGELMLLHVDDPHPASAPATVRSVDGCIVRIVCGGDPVALGECEAAAGHDVVVAGGGTPHPQHYFTPRLHGLISRTRASLVIVHAAASCGEFDERWFRLDRRQMHGS
jgi:hypothetical protein